MNESPIFVLTFILYIVAAFFYLSFLFTRKESRARAGAIVAVIGLAAHTAALVVRTIESGHAPFTNMYESISFLSWAFVLAFLLIDRKFKIPKIGPYLLLIVIGLMALASSPLMPKEATPLVPALQSYWLWLHVSVTLLGEAFFAVAFIARSTTASSCSADCAASIWSRRSDSTRMRLSSALAATSSMLAPSTGCRSIICAA